VDKELKQKTKLTLANRVHNTSTRFHIDHFCPPQLNTLGEKC